LFCLFAGKIPAKESGGARQLAGKRLYLTKWWVPSLLGWGNDFVMPVFLRVLEG
jgi:hypothetical protein